MGKLSLELGEETHYALSGHSGGGVGRSHVKVTLKTKAEAVERISYSADLAS